MPYDNRKNNGYNTRQGSGYGQNYQTRQQQNYGQRQGQQYPQRESYPGQGANEECKSPTVFYNNWGFKETWITKGADKDLPQKAEEAGKYMADKKLTPTKLRGFYGEIKRIQVKGFEAEKSSFYMLLPKIAYAIGREKSSNKDTSALELFQMIFVAAAEHVSPKTSNEESAPGQTDGKEKKTDYNARYTNFCNLMEAILAYHSYHDNINSKSNNKNDNKNKQP